MGVIPTPKKRRAPELRIREAAVSAAIARVLRLRSDVFAWRNNTGATRTEGGRFIRFGLVGSADFLGVIRGGRFLAVEVKRPRGGRQTEAQKAFEAAVVAQGGLYVLATSADDVMRAIDEEVGLVRRKEGA